MAPEKDKSDQTDEILTQFVQPTASMKRRSEFSYLVMIYGEHLGRRFTIKDEPLMIGRSSDCKIQLGDESVSRNHCKITPNEDSIVISDLGSTNGTFVNGEPIKERSLNDGDQIMAGRGMLKYISGDNIEHAYHEEIYRLMTTDHLTGAHNKKFFENELKREFHRFFRHKRPLSLAMMDIDHFKKFNDEYGHLAGDRILAQLGRIISDSIRMEDIFCRYGGEEFVVLMPELDLDGAAEFSERVRKVIADSDFKFEKLTLKVTMSLGVANADSTMSRSKDLVEAADNNLYKAKSAGRNKVFYLIGC